MGRTLLVAGLLAAATLAGCASSCPPAPAVPQCEDRPADAPAPTVISSGPVVADAVALTAPESDLQSGSSAAGATPSALAVHLQADGKATVGAQQVASMSAAADRAREARAGGADDLRVVVYVERGVARQRVIEAVDELQKAGVVRIGIVLDQDRASPAASSSLPAAQQKLSLPEVAVHNVGLHIGGGPNDEASKAPFKQAIEKRFADFRRCYTKVNHPGKGGVFGVDLRIGRKGGRAQVQQPRTSMGGQEFRDCVLGVFSEVEFAKPPRGPTVISYSIRFTVGGK